MAPAPRKRDTTGVHQLLVVLTQIDPIVWRRIQVPARYSFWDLHVAIQDAMGWLDYHLHEFTLTDPTEGHLERIGIPGEELDDEIPCTPGWNVRVSDYFHCFGQGTQVCLYVYDFGDDWQHVVAYEGLRPRVPGLKYPVCISGAGACPPEDCGGPRGYAEFLEAIRDKKHPEHREMLEWVGGSFSPDRFDPDAVSFDNPRKRWRNAFEGE